MALIDDWIAYRDGNAEFDKIHFEALLKTHQSPEELQQIFAGLPGGDAAIERLQDLFANTYSGAFGYQLPRERNLIEQHVALALVREIGTNLRSYLRAIRADDLADEMEGLQVVMASMDDLKTAINDLDHIEYGLHDEGSDHYRNQVFEPRRLSGHLIEAVYALTKYDTVTRYIVDPIWPYVLKYEPNYRLYLGGYRYFVRNDAIIVAKEKF